MLRFIQNIGDYFSSNYFDEDFPAKVLAKTGLSKLFKVLSSGYRERENEQNKSFKVRHIDSPLFNDKRLKHLTSFLQF